MMFSRFLSCGFRRKRLVQKLWRHLLTTTAFLASEAGELSVNSSEGTAMASFQQD